MQLLGEKKAGNYGARHMTTYPLAGPGLIAPFWFDKVRHGQHQAIVSGDGSAVTLEGVALPFRAARPAPGSPVKVWLNTQGLFVCATEADLDADAAARRAVQEATALARRDRLNNLRAEAEAFNARLHLPSNGMSASRTRSPACLRRHGATAAARRPSSTSTWSSRWLPAA